MRYDTDQLDQRQDSDRPDQPEPGHVPGERPVDAPAWEEAERPDEDTAQPVEIRPEADADRAIDADRAMDADPAMDGGPALDSDPAMDADPAIDADPAMDADPEAAELMPGAVPEQPLTAMWPTQTMEQYRERWREIQLRFVDEPSSAAGEAQDLLADVLDTFSQTLAARKAEIDSWGETGHQDTEEMRVAIRRYRDLLDQVLSH